MLYAEDFTAGQEFPFGSWKITDEDIVEFAEQWDPLPMHLDHDLAAVGPHGGLIASGLHTLVVYQRLVVDALWSRTAVIAGRGFERMRLLRPVRPGTVLTGSALISAVTFRPSRGNSVLTVEGRLVDQDGNPVLELTSDGVIADRAGWESLHSGTAATGPTEPTPPGGA